MTRVLTDELRSAFKEPFGRLITGDDPVAIAEESWTDENPVIAVGDIVTYHLREAGHVPKVSIIDDRSMREGTENEFRQSVRKGFDRHVEARNPPGHLTDDLVDAVRRAIEEEGSTQIVVDGEEDLAVMPAVKLAEPGTRVLYGQPDRGVVVVDVTEERKRQINRLLDKMEVIDGD